MKKMVLKKTILLDWLVAEYPDSSKNNLKSWVLGKRVLVSGKEIAFPGYQLISGDEVEILPKRTFIQNRSEVLYEDKDLIVIDKPPGLLSVAKDINTETNVHDDLKQYLKPIRPFPVHRLDKDTSGVLIFAKSEKARDYFDALFEKHEVKRQYLALVEGNTPQQGTWKNYLFENKSMTMQVTKDQKKGKLAITHFHKLKSFAGMTLLQIDLETGRKNQIRVQATHAGHPIVGDKKYKANSNPLKRLGLHAFALSFTHPTTRKKMRFSSRISFPEFSQSSIVYQSCPKSHLETHGIKKSNDKEVY